MRRFVLALIAMTMFVASVSGYSPRRPFSYKSLSPDGHFVFVMIGSHSAEEEPKHWIDPRSAEIKAIRDKWTTSGMYRNDGSTTPLWTVDWYSYEVDVPPGGEYVIRYRSEGLERNPGPALGFYRNGELVRGYEIAELMSLPFLANRGSWVSEHRLSDDSRTVTVETEAGDRYVFDVQTGEMLERFRPIRYVVVSTVVLGVLGLVWWFRRRRRRRVPAPID